MAPQRRRKLVPVEEVALDQSVGGQGKVVRDEVAPAGGEVVVDGDFMTVREQSVRHRAADEPRPPGDERLQSSGSKRLETMVRSQVMGSRKKRTFLPSE